jgi:hypothetical protein
MKAYFRGCECDLEDGVLTYKGHTQFVSCCFCKKLMTIHAKQNGSVYLTCQPCREELKEKRRLLRAPQFIPDED